MRQTSSSWDVIEGSGVAAAESRDVPPFDSVELAGSNDVEIHVGGEPSVVVHADDNLLDQVTTEVRGSMLRIDNRPGASFTTRAAMKVEVTAPRLEAVSLAGSGSISVTDVDTEAFAVSLAGSGLLRAAGRAGRLDLELNGSGDAQFDELVSRDVNVQVSGSGRVDVTATESLAASVPGSGLVRYRGDPAQVTTSVPGTGAILRR